MNYNLNFSYQNNPQKTLGNYPVITLAKTPIAIDVGCGTGFFSLMYSKYFTSIYSIDASYTNLSLFNKNIKLNNISNCFSFHFAASNKSGKIIKIINPCNSHYNNVCVDDNTIFKNTKDGLSTHKLNESGLSGNNSQYHYAMSLSYDDLLIYFNLETIDFLKVDIEGAEYDFLYDKDIGKIDVLAIEVHFLENKQSQNLLKQLLDTFFVVHSSEKKHGEYLMINNKFNGVYDLNKILKPEKEYKYLWN
jgi:FkbM family methyltransferase